MILHPLRRADQHPLAVAGGRQGGARCPEGPEAGGALVHRAFRLRQVDHRQPPGKEAARGRQAHLHARRRQCPSWAQPRSRLHRGRPRRKHPARRRSGEADGRCRPHRAGVVHLAVPRRAPHGARDRWPKASSSRCSSTRRSTNAPGAIRKGSTPRRCAARSRTLPASIRPTKRRRMPDIHLETAGRSPDELVEATRALAAQERLLLTPAIRFSTGIGRGVARSVGRACAGGRARNHRGHACRHCSRGEGGRIAGHGG